MTTQLEDPPIRQREPSAAPTITRKALTRMYVRLQRSHALLKALEHSNDLARYSQAVHRWWYPAAQSFYAACAALRFGAGSLTHGFVPIGRSAQDWAEDYRRAWILAEAER